MRNFPLSDSLESYTPSAFGAAQILILNSILLNLRVIPHFSRAGAPWDLHGFLRTSRLVLFKNRGFCGTFNIFTFKASIC